MPDPSRSGNLENVRSFAMGLAAVLLSACGGYPNATDSERDFVDSPAIDEPLVDDSAPDDNTEPESAQWVCSYAPTYDRDWHNDVVCSNGVDQERPYLREWDSFITEDEIMESAREYERQLNGE